MVVTTAEPQPQESEQGEEHGTSSSLEAVGELSKWTTEWRVHTQEGQNHRPGPTSFGRMAGYAGWWDTEHSPGHPSKEGGLYAEGLES